MMNDFFMERSYFETNYLGKTDFCSKIIPTVAIVNFRNHKRAFRWTQRNSHIYIFRLYILGRFLLVEQKFAK